MNIGSPPERRKTVDRRIADEGPPPGQEEQRRTPERRKPDVEYVEFDEEIVVPSPEPTE